MGNENYSGARYPEGSEAGNVPAAVKLTTASITPSLVPKFATTAARDTAVAAWLAEPANSGKTAEGMLNYITARKAFSYHDGTGWKWLADNILAMATRTSDADSTAGSLVDILSVGPFTLPAGNRLIKVCIRSQATQLTGASTTESKPQLQVIGSGFAAGYNSVTRLTTFPGAQTSIESTFHVITSGAVTFALKGRDGHETVAQNVRFSYSWLQVFDLGATDF